MKYNFFDTHRLCYVCCPYLETVPLSVCAKKDLTAPKENCETSVKRVFNV